ncbi:hypothetical protein HDZ31DRAFT_42843 [Schizophyllum fasciatum]
MPSARKNTSALQRGSACLCCRRRKLKCDGTRPVCRQCVKMNRADECEFDDRKQKSRTQKLREKLAMLEKKVRELEADTLGESSTSDASSSGSSPHACTSPDTDGIADAHLTGDLTGAYDASAFNDFVFPVLAGLEAHPALVTSDPSIDLVNIVLSDPAHALPGDVLDANGASSSPASGWDQDEILPDANRQVLLEVFLAHRHQCWFDGDISRFQLPSHPRPPHPALWNAVYLLGCHYAQSPYFSESEPAFFSRALREIAVALDKSDRLVDVVQASCLLAVYLYANARALEGYCHSFSAARLAVGLGLHQLPSYGGAEYASDALGEHVHPIHIQPPRDAEEHRDRVSAFWQVFMVDRCWSVTNGLPVALPDGEGDQIRIKTPWPRPAGEDCPMDWLGAGPINTLLLDDGTFDEPTAYIPALRAKATALYERAARLSTKPQHSESAWLENQIVANAVQRFLSILPPFSNYEAWRTNPPFVDVELLVVHSIAHVAAIHAQKDILCMESFVASNSVMAFIRQLNDSDFEFLDPVISSCWSAVARFYMRIIGAMNSMIPASMPPYTVEGIHQEVRLIIHALQTLSAFVPLAGEYCTRIQEEWAPLAML